MKVFFIRHGQSMANLEKRAGGWGQFPLSAKGIEQAQSLQPVLKDIHFDKIYCSDLKRVKMTLENAIPKSEAEYRWELREISVGSTSGFLRTDLKEQYGDLFTNAVANHDYTPFDGESEQMLQARMFPFMQELEKLENMENVAVFGSEGTLQQMMNYVLKAKVNIHSIRIPNCSVSVFTFNDGKWRLEKFAYTPSLLA